MGFRKSNQCVGKGSGQYLTEYDSLEDAQEGAEHARENYDSDFIAYECDRCGLWHLAPRNRQTPSKSCRTCRGTNGKPKDAYVTEQHAVRRAEILHAERAMRLRVYACPHGQGWHLTKS